MPPKYIDLLQILAENTQLEHDLLIPFKLYEQVKSQTFLLYYWNCVQSDFTKSFFVKLALLTHKSFKATDSNSKPDEYLVINQFTFFGIQESPAELSTTRRRIMSKNKFNFISRNLKRFESIHFQAGI